ncbi:phosphoribosylamine--glycine ligase [Methanogenium sp. S4BF]|uniref:phosphoribosylamine--glycine ligase n=1 Tax=Methanogenium sp. S4BF TaxID=1789226 RepID=UPI00241800E8|nr:phosphoribosylamine--glycine ligase [Methanogenium sp. S4BF]WFN35070.1 phosphoribosylamine--glycine ligase [Methanogenium sp. S4BF]
MDMKILVVGGGGREHALADALSRSSNVEIYSVMGKENPGIAALSADVYICKETEIHRVADYAEANGVEYAVVGPEAPLEAGLANELAARGISCIGPRKEAARLETDKEFCRNLMRDHGIEGCPGYQAFHNPEEACRYIDEHDVDLAIKPIGLTGGKGVKIMGEHVDSVGAKDYIREIGGDVVLEERLIGEEFTLMAFVDGTHLVPMPLVQDHKRAYEGDVGPNTGGMGSYSMEDHSFPFVTDADRTRAFAIMEKVIAALNAEGHQYVGFLYGQFMNTADGPKVIEFNARFGDPEAMNLLSLLTSDFAVILVKMAAGTLTPEDVTFAHQASVCKYLVPEGYPDAPQEGQPLIIGNYGGAKLFFANITFKDGEYYTQTSRTLAFVGIGDTLAEAEMQAEQAAASVSGAVRYRHDIGTMGVLEKRIAHMRDIR